MILMHLKCIKFSYCYFQSFKDNFKAGDLPQSTSTPRESIDPQNTSTPREPVNQHASQSNTRSSSTKPINQSTLRETVVTPAGQKQHNLNTSNNSSGNAAGKMGELSFSALAD